MSKKLFTLVLVMAAFMASSAFAGAKLKINDTDTIDLGFRVQTIGVMTQDDLNNDGSWDSVHYWKTRRARIRLGANIGDKWSIFLQTDHSGKTVNMIDAWVDYKVDPWFQIIMGRNMAPSNRQNLTSSGALMAIDRPGLCYKALTWGAKATGVFTNATFPNSMVPLSTSVDAVRDQGVTFFGSGDVGGNGHLKYYAGMYNGVQASTSAINKDSNKDRFAARVQYNLWDAEGGYYNSSTYLGKKKTLGIGVSYDTQKEVGVSATSATDPTPMLVDYTLITADGFLEYPMTNGDAITVEGGWSKSDFNDMFSFMNGQGTGFYGQAGYYLNSGFQPWVEYEKFSSDATGDFGSYKTFRVGLSYYMEGQNANIKVGFEQFKSDTPLTYNTDGDPVEDTVNSFVIGFFTNY